MGIRSHWQETVLDAFKDFGIEVSDAGSGKYTLFSFSGKSLAVNLISLNNDYTPEELLALQAQYLGSNQFLVQLWEDIWATRRLQVISRLRSLLGLNQKIHGRKTRVVALSQRQADAFLIENHLQASAKSKYRFALTMNDQLVALACFSKLRLMKGRGAGYKSAEVIRFASLTGYTVTGGFSKLLQHFIAEFAPDDIMSYADRDWSGGKVYGQAGFELVSATPPAEICLHPQSMVRYFPHRLPALSPAGNGEQDFIKIFNTGNLKFIYYV